MGKNSDYLSTKKIRQLATQGYTPEQISKGIENGSIKSSYKKQNSGGNNNTGNNLPSLNGSGASAPTTESVVNGVSNGDWMNPNNSYINSGAYLDNQNISDRGKASMASFARQGFNFDSVPSNIGEYSGVDANSSDQDKFMSYLYNNMRNMSPEQQSETLQGIQDQYTAAGRTDDVFGAYNNAVFGDGTGTNGLAAQEAQRNAAPAKEEYTLSNRAQRAEATSERDQLQAQLDEYKSGELYNNAKREHPNASEAELAMYVQQAYDNELKLNPNGDLAKADAKIKELDSTIGNLSSAIDEEDKATAKADENYRIGYTNDNYMAPAMEFAQENPSVARRIAIDYAMSKLGYPEQAAVESANILLNRMPTDLALEIASERDRYMQYDNLMNQYASQRQQAADSQRLQQMTGNRFDVNNYSPYGNSNIFNYRP